MSSYFPFVVLVLLIIVVALLALSVRILREYERAVVFTLGRVSRGSRGQAWCC